MNNLTPGDYTISFIFMQVSLNYYLFPQEYMQHGCMQKGTHFSDLTVVIHQIMVSKRKKSFNIPILIILLYFSLQEMYASVAAKT
jgi:hypothetical protein